MILYTSGTTAKPKGVMLDESQFAANCRDSLVHIPITSADKIIVALPLFHSFGNIMALIVFMKGGTLILLKQFAPKSILQNITDHKATILPLVPTIYSFLVDLNASGICTRQHGSRAPLHPSIATTLVPPPWKRISLPAASEPNMS